MIKFTSLKPPKIDTILNALPFQTFHTLKTRLVEKLNLNPLSLRFLFKNKAVSDSKSVHEVFGEATEGQITVIVMKNVATAVNIANLGRQADEDKITIENDEFWEGIRNVV